jgi:hypothetical protein
MRRHVKLIAQGDFIYFCDRINENALYCLNRSVLADNDQIFGKVQFESYDTPDSRTIPAFPLIKVGEDKNYDLFDIIEPSPIDFQINRIKWIWVFCNPTT